MTGTNATITANNVTSPGAICGNKADYRLLYSTA